MTDNVITLDVDTTLPIPAERILEGARLNEVSPLLLIGWKPDGELYLASTHGDLGEHLILLERAKAVLLDQAVAR